MFVTFAFMYTQLHNVNTCSLYCTAKTLAETASALRYLQGVYTKAKNIPL